ncbi:MAG TPA: glycosyltransferase, partial [Bacteroidia bacterium]|nr:glycosyltransferase [Bacteroidia bacterium]
MKHRILLISYVFPPFPGVGGRRWAKFARYLADAGHEVHLICAKNILKDQSAWTHDVLHPGIFLYPLPARYPSILLQQPATFFEKLLYKFWQTIFMLVSNGSIFERALFWKKQLHKKAIDLIQSKRIETVIVSGPPFHLLHHAVAIKEKMNNLHVIVDLRDPWTDNKDFFGFSRMSKSRLAYEQKLERETMLGADAILTVASKMSEALVKKYPAVKGKVFTLINGFDPREVTTTQFEGEMVRSEKMRFVYAGSLYPNLEYVFIPFAEYLVRLRKKDPHLYSKLVFDFYGSAAVE